MPYYSVFDYNFLLTSWDKVVCSIMDFVRRIHNLFLNDLHVTLRLVFVCIEFLDVDIKFGLLLEINLHVLVVFELSFTTHAEVFHREVSLLMNVPVVILRDWRRRVVIIFGQESAVWHF